MLSNLLPYFPKLLLGQLSTELDQPPPFETHSVLQTEAVSLFADISGFTAFSRGFGWARQTRLREVDHFD